MEQGDVWSPVDSPSEGAARRFVAAARAAAGNRQRDDLGDEVGDNGTTTAGAVAGCSWTPGMRKDPLRAGMVARPEKAQIRWTHSRCLHHHTAAALVQLVED